MWANMLSRIKIWFGEHWTTLVLVGVTLTLSIVLLNAINLNFVLPDPEGGYVTKSELASTVQAAHAERAGIAKQVEENHLILKRVEEQINKLEGDR
jgi:hypothetical protein